MASAENVVSREPRSHQEFTSADRDGGAGGAAQADSERGLDSAGNAKKKAKKRAKKKKSAKSENSVAGSAELPSNDVLKMPAMAEGSAPKLPPGVKVKRRPVKHRPSSGTGGPSNEDTGLINAKGASKRAPITGKKSTTASKDTPLTGWRLNPNGAQNGPIPDLFMNPDEEGEAATATKPEAAAPSPPATAAHGAHNHREPKPGSLGSESLFPGLYRELSSLQPVACDEDNLELQEYWEQLSDAERAKFVDIDAAALFALIGQERQLCNCKSCVDKLHAFDEELVHIYSANLPRLEKYAQILQSSRKQEVVEGVKKYFLELVGDQSPELLWGRPSFHNLLSKNPAANVEAPKDSPTSGLFPPPPFPAPNASKNQKINAHQFLTRLKEQARAHLKEKEILARAHMVANAMRNSEARGEQPLDLAKAVAEVFGGDKSIEKGKEGSEDQTYLTTQLTDAMAKGPDDGGLSENSESPNKILGMLTGISMFCQNEGVKNVDQLSFLSKMFSSELIAKAPDRVQEMFSHFVKDIKENNGRDLLSVMEKISNSPPDIMAVDDLKTNEAALKMAEYYKYVRGLDAPASEFDLEVRVDRPPAFNANVSKDSSGHELLVDEVYSENDYEESELDDYADDGSLYEEPGDDHDTLEGRGVTNGEDVQDAVQEGEASDDDDAPQESDYSLDEENGDLFEDSEADAVLNPLKKLSDTSYIEEVESAFEDFSQAAAAEDDVAFYEEQEKKRKIQISWYLHFLFSRVLERRLVKAYREHLTRKRQQSLLDELAEEEAKAQADAARKQKDKDKKKTKKLAAKLQREEEAQRKLAEAKQKADAAREKENAIRQQQLAMDRAKEEARCRKIEERMAQLALENQKEPDSKKLSETKKDAAHTTETPHVEATRPASSKSQPSGSGTAASTKGREATNSAGTAVSTAKSKKESKTKGSSGAEKSKPEELKGEKAREKESKAAEKSAEKSVEKSNEKRDRAKDEKASKAVPEKAKQAPPKSKETTVKQPPAHEAADSVQSPMVQHLYPQEQPVAGTPTNAPPVIGTPLYNGSPLSRPTMMTQLSQPRVPGARSMAPAPMSMHQEMPQSMDELSGLPSNFGALNPNMAAGPNMGSGAGSSLNPGMGANLTNPGLSSNLGTKLGHSFTPNIGSSLGSGLGSNIGAGVSLPGAQSSNTLGLMGSAHTNVMGPNAHLMGNHSNKAPGAGAPLQAPGMHPSQDLGPNYGPLASSFTSSPHSGSMNLGSVGTPLGGPLGVGMSRQVPQSQVASSQASLPQYPSASSLWSMSGSGASTSLGNAPGASAWSRSPWSDDRNQDPVGVSQRKTSSPWMNSPPLGKPAVSGRDIADAARASYVELRHLGVDGYLPSQMLYHAAQTKSGLWFSQNELYKACSQLPTFECVRDNVGLITHIKI